MPNETNPAMRLGPLVSLQHSGSFLQHIFCSWVGKPVEGLGFEFGD